MGTERFTRILPGLVSYKERLDKWNVFSAVSEVERQPDRNM